MVYSLLRCSSSDPDIDWEQIQFHRISRLYATPPPGSAKRQYYVVLRCLYNSLIPSTTCIFTTCTVAVMVSPTGCWISLASVSDTGTGKSTFLVPGIWNFAKISSTTVLCSARPWYKMHPWGDHVESSATRCIQSTRPKKSLLWLMDNGPYAP